MLCLGALALLCWPARPALLRMAGWSQLSASTSGVHLRRFANAGRTPGGSRIAGRPVWMLGVIAVGAAAVPAGPAAIGAALLVAATVAVLTSAELRRRRDSRQLGALLVATRTLAREVRTGASPVTAVLATAAAHPACAAALEELAVAVVGRRGGSATPGGGGGGGRGGGGGGGGGPAGADGRLDQAAEVVARLGDGWELSARYGVPWAALIETVATDLADRQRAKALRTAQVAGPRVSGYVLAVMPALGILLGAGMGADPLHVLLHTGVGAVLLVVGSALTCLGLAWTASIVRS